MGMWAAVILLNKKSVIIIGHIVGCYLPCSENVNSPGRLLSVLLKEKGRFLPQGL